MSVVMKIVFSLSLSGSFLILVLFFVKSVFKNTFSRQWQYYIWLVVIARLLLPVAPETSIVGTLFTNVNQMHREDYVVLQGTEKSAMDSDARQDFPMEEDTVIQYRESGQNNSRISGSGSLITEVSLKSVKESLLRNLWIPWLVGALLLLLRKITLYQSFAGYVKAGHREVADTDLLDRLAQIGEQAGVRRPVELYVNSLVSSPLLIGFLHPCIILPTADLTREDFTYTIWHELIHFRKKDMFYKWLVQITICLHWFNPLVWLMGWEINRACEFSCDETVLRTLGEEERRAYGNTLFRAMGEGGSFKEFPVSVTLNESAELLKERLRAIMDFKKRSRLTTTISIVSAVAMMMGATAVGAYVEPVRTAKVTNVVTKSTSSDPDGKFADDAESENMAGTSAKDQDTLDSNMEALIIGDQSTADRDAANQATQNDETEKSAEDLAEYWAEQYYEKDMVSQFAAMFMALDMDAQRRWLDTVYSAGKINFFSAAVCRLDSSSPLVGEFLERTYADENVSCFSMLIGSLGSDSPLIAEYAEKAYADNSIAFFSILAPQMSADVLQNWQDRAREENMSLSFQYMLPGMLPDSDDWNQWKLEAEQNDAREYQEWGIIRDGQDFYYQNQLVRVFFDEYDGEQVIRTLQCNPAGTVDVKVTRSVRNKIISVQYMTEEEVTELFGTQDLSDGDYEEEYELEEEDLAFPEKGFAKEEKKEEEFDPENDVYRLTMEELPEDVSDLMMDDCEIRTWYVYHVKGQQYLCYKGFAWSYGYQIAYDENGWRINIQRFQKKEYGDVLLALPDNGPITVYCDGQKAALIEVGVPEMNG